MLFTKIAIYAWGINGDNKTYVDFCIPCLITHSALAL